MRQRRPGSTREKGEQGEMRDGTRGPGLRIRNLLVGVVVMLVQWPSLTTSLSTGQCGGALGMQSGAIPDEHISASSYFDAAVNAIYGRAHVEVGGGAWCPREMVYREGTEYLEVNLGAPHLVTKVEVQGRFGNGQGREFARQYKLQLWRPGLSHWVTYTDSRGQQLLEGNSNTYLAHPSHLRPPSVASRVRFVPHSDHPRTVCMRVELYGCRYTGGLVSYSMPDGDARGGSDLSFRDLTYDGVKRGGWLRGGLGQLTDGETGHTNFRVNAQGQGKGYEWVGWRNDTRGGRPVNITFSFDAPRNFSALYIYANNLFTKETQVFSKVKILFSMEMEKEEDEKSEKQKREEAKRTTSGRSGETGSGGGTGGFDAHPPVIFEYVVDRIFENARNVTIRLPNVTARSVRLQLFFALRWILISEITFESVPCACNLTEETQGAVSGAAPRGDAGRAPTTPASPTLGPAPPGQSPVVPARAPAPGLLVGGLAALGVVFGVLPVAACLLHHRARLARRSKTPLAADPHKVSMKMKDFHINVNLTAGAAGLSRARGGELYGRVALQDPAAGPYQEPHPLMPAPPDSLKGPTTTDTDDSVDYAVPDLSLTSPTPFPEAWRPPLPLTRPPSTLPPPAQHYAATQLCHASSIQGVTGCVIYATADEAGVSGAGPSGALPEPAVPEVAPHQVRVLEALGEGKFGTVTLCEVEGLEGGPRLAAMKSLRMGAAEGTKKDFRQEARVLARLHDPNIVRLVGVVTRAEPLALLLEYMVHGDLYQFLRRHRCGPEGAEELPELSYGALVYAALQVASGMTHLETLGVVHRDLAARNCLVGEALTIKISDFGMSRPLYSSDYYRLGEGRALLPIRWMAWESILHGRFSTKSDVWAFGVTLWEVFTLARRQPHADLSDDQVLENVSRCYLGDGVPMMTLPQPPLCPREMYDMMSACWRPAARQRPPFWEVLLFLRRKNLGYSLDYTG
uniref:Protein kinase domain-containing protein n=3 Tax=Scylla TaxID=6760 RepID=A0A0P4WCZ3_SCYOL